MMTFDLKWMCEWLIKLKFIEMHERFHNSINFKWNMNKHEMKKEKKTILTSMLWKPGSEMICKWHECSYQQYEKD